MAGPCTAGGYARIATLVEARRRQYPDAMVLLDGGDTFHGTYPVIQTKGELLVPILNQLKFDAMTAHWDFAYGPRRLTELAGQLTFPILGINVFHDGSNEPFFPGYRVLERGGVRIGVIGVACNIVDNMMPPRFSEGIRFSLGRDELAPVIETLRRDEQVDLVVLLSHLGLPRTHKLLTETPGVDVCLCGHIHDRITQPLHPNGTILIESGYHGIFLGELLLTLEDGRIVDHRHQLTEVAESVPPDPAMQSLIDRAMAPYRDELARMVSETTAPLDRSTCLEATMDNLLSRPLRKRPGRRWCFLTAGGTAHPSLPGRLRWGNFTTSSRWTRLFPRSI